MLCTCVIRVSLVSSSALCSLEVELDCISRTVVISCYLVIPINTEIIKVNVCYIRCACRNLSCDICLTCICETVKRLCILACSRIPLINSFDRADNNKLCTYAVTSLIVLIKVCSIACRAVILVIVTIFNIHIVACLNTTFYHIEMVIIRSVKSAFTFVYHCHVSWKIHGKTCTYASVILQIKIRK